MYCYERLRDLREDADLTQKKIGELLHTTQQQYAKYELGIQEIPTHHLITLADYYHVSLDYIVGRSEWSDVELWRMKNVLSEKQKERLIEQLKKN